MNTDIISKAARATLDGTLAFPEIVGLLLSTGVEYYHVDYVGRRKTFYGATGDAVVTPIPFEDLPAVADDLDVAALKADIVDSQQHGQSFRAFSRRAMAAGVLGYYAFLRGQRVTYFGRQGDLHTEWFPGAGPTAQ